MSSWTSEKTCLIYRQREGSEELEKSKGVNSQPLNNWDFSSSKFLNNWAKWNGSVEGVE